MNLYILILIFLIIQTNALIDFEIFSKDIHITKYNTIKEYSKNDIFIEICNTNTKDYKYLMTNILNTRRFNNEITFLYTYFSNFIPNYGIYYCYDDRKEEIFNIIVQTKLNQIINNDILIYITIILCGIFEIIYIYIKMFIYMSISFILYFIGKYI